MSQPSDDINTEPGNLHWERVIGPKRLGYPIDSGKDTCISKEIKEIGDLIDEAFNIEASR